MSTEANKMLVRRLIEEVWNTGDYGPLEELATPDFAESTRQGNLRTRASLPDLHHRIDDMIAEGDQVVVCWTVTGTHLGELVTQIGSLPPSGKPVTVTGNHTFRIAGGKIAQSSGKSDWLGFFREIGATVTPGPGQ
jgi:predicted ester cyclase